MAHLDTAYKLGALRAMEDFQVELNKRGAVLPDLSGATKAPAPSGKPIPYKPAPVQKRPAPKETWPTGKTPGQTVPR